MSRAILWGLACVTAFSAFGCKKNEDASPTEAAASASAAVVATVTAPATDSAVAIPIPVPTTTLPKPVDHTADANAVSACCAALRSDASRPRIPAGEKARLESAATTCSGEVELVRRGSAKRPEVISAIRAAARGGSLPPACN